MKQFSLTLSAVLFGAILCAPQAYAQARCAQGYVWREATPNDYVCVTPQARQQAWSDNAQQDARRAGSGPYGYETCKQGYVWREATANDKVCVPPATRDQARYDNSQARQRVQAQRID
ncbi:MAG: hypothetical protein U1E61_09305 [Bradyrhizobium sp.]